MQYNIHTCGYYYVQSLSRQFRADPPFRSLFYDWIETVNDQTTAFERETTNSHNLNQIQPTRSTVHTLTHN